MMALAYYILEQNVIGHQGGDPCLNMGDHHYIHPIMASANYILEGNVTEEVPGNVSGGDQCLNVGVYQYTHTPWGDLCLNMGHNCNITHIPMLAPAYISGGDP